MAMNNTTRAGSGGKHYGKGTEQKTPTGGKKHGGATTRGNNERGGNVGTMSGAQYSGAKLPPQKSLGTPRAGTSWS